MKKDFVQVKTRTGFNTALAAGEINQEQIAFIEDTNEIWAKGVFYSTTNGLTIGENGNWFINGVDTGKTSKGDKGEPGPRGETGTSAAVGGDVKILTDLNSPDINDAKAVLKASLTKDKLTELEQFKRLDWAGSYGNTRLQIPIKERKYGYRLSYKHPEKGVIYEMYIKEHTGLIDDGNWKSDVNWYKIVFTKDIKRILETDIIKEAYFENLDKLSNYQNIIYDLSISKNIVSGVKQISLNANGENIANIYSDTNTVKLQEGAYIAKVPTNKLSYNVNGYVLIDFDKFPSDITNIRLKYTYTELSNIDNSPSIKNIYSVKDVDNKLDVFDQRINLKEFIQPKSNTKNLLIRTDKYLLSPQNIEKGETLRFFDKTKDTTSFGTCLLVEVKPNTTYVFKRANTILEFDKDGNYIKKSKPEGYKIITLTTSQNTKYVTVDVYMNPNGVADLSNAISISEGAEVPNYSQQYNKFPIVDSLDGFPRTFKTSSDRWVGKRLLAIGDSVVAAGKWQKTVGDLLGMKIRTHAKGGIGIVQMVDGESGAGLPPGSFDPDTGAGNTLYRLNEKDVTDVDIIIISGFYNERDGVYNNPEGIGKDTDMYPTQQTFMGKLNYAIKRIYEELNKAKNFNCKIVVCTAHRYGKYPWNDRTAYEDGEDLFKATIGPARYWSLPCIDLMHNANINSYNWNIFQNNPSVANPYYIPADGINDGTNKPFASSNSLPTPVQQGNVATVTDIEGWKQYRYDSGSWKQQDYYKYPWIGDQLHPNDKGYARIGEYIAGFISKL